MFLTVIGVISPDTAAFGDNYVEFAEARPILAYAKISNKQ